MTTTIVPAGMTSNNAVVNGPDVLNVKAGGATVGATINVGGSENVDGVATGTDVNGGTLTLYSGGAASGTVVNGGTLLLHANTAASNTTLNSGGQLSVDGTTTGTIVNAGGSEMIYSGGMATGTVINSGGSQTINSGAITNTIVINESGRLNLSAGGTAANGISFNGANIILDIDGSVMPATSISGFAITDQIDLSDITYATSDTVVASGDNVVVTAANGTTATLTIAGAHNYKFGLTAEADGGGGTALAIVSAAPYPIVSSPTLDVAENAPATAIGIAAPSESNYILAQLAIIAGTLPEDGTVTLADGITAVIAGQTLSAADLAGLLFTPTIGTFATSASFTYLVTDPAGNATSGTATLAIGPAIGNPAVSSPTLDVAENAPATAIGIAAPSDPNYTLAQLAIVAGTLPADGTVTLADGITAVIAGQTLSAADLAGLLFTPTTGTFTTSASFTYLVMDPAGNATTGTATLAIGPAISPPPTPTTGGTTSNAHDTTVYTANSGFAAAITDILQTARLDVAAAIQLSSDGATIFTAGLDSNGNVTVFSTVDSAGHVISVTGTGHSVIVAGSGNDTVTLANGVDSLVTGLGTNTVHLQSGNHVVYSEGTDIIDAGQGDDQIGISGNTVIEAGAAKLHITLDTGSTLTLHTGTASVVVEGAFGCGAFSGGTDGNNFLVAGTGATTLYAGGDGDMLMASGGTGTTMNGWGGDETFIGQYSSGNDVFNANAANALMIGGTGTNTFNIGTGHTNIVAQLGTDLFNFVSGHANTTYIAGFDVNTGKINLSGFAADEVDHALATATVYQGSEVLHLRDGSSIAFGNLTGLTNSSFT